MNLVVGLMLAVVLLVVAMVAVASRQSVVNAAGQVGARAFTPPRGLDKVPMTVPDDNAMTADRIDPGGGHASHVVVA